MGEITEKSVILDDPITLKEIHDNAGKLKNNKSVGFDNISNEIIKYNIDILGKAIQKLFNTILQTGIWPKKWKENYIVPIHKSGDTEDTNNYRGIAVSK